MVVSNLLDVGIRERIELITTINLILSDKERWLFFAKNREPRWRWRKKNEAWWKFDIHLYWKCNIVIWKCRMGTMEIT